MSDFDLIPTAEKYVKGRRLKGATTNKLIDYLNYIVDHALEKPCHVLIQGELGICTAIYGKKSNQAGKILAIQESSPITIYEDDEAMWTPWGEGDGGGYGGEVSLEEETTEVYSGDSSLKTTATSGGADYMDAGFEHTYTVPQDWTTRDFLFCYVYAASWNVGKLRIIDDSGNWREWNLASTFGQWEKNALKLSTGDSESATPPDLSKVKTIRCYSSVFFASGYGYFDLAFLDYEIHSYIINSVLSSLTDGRTWMERVSLSGQFPLLDAISMVSRLDFEMIGAELYKDLGYAGGNSFLVGSNLADVYVHGGRILDPNNIAGSTEPVVLHGTNLHVFKNYFDFGSSQAQIVLRGDHLRVHHNRIVSGKWGIIASGYQSPLNDFKAWHNELENLMDIPTFDSGGATNNAKQVYWIYNWYKNCGKGHNCSSYSYDYIFAFNYLEDCGSTYLKSTRTLFAHNILMNCTKETYAPVRITADGSDAHLVDNIIDGSATGQAGIDILGGDGIITKNILKNISSTPTIKFTNKALEIEIGRNKGFNPVGVLTNPFDTVNDVISLKGDANTPEASTLYVVKNVDIYIKASSQSDGGVKVYSPDDTEIMDLGVGGFNAIFLPIGYKINFGAFTGAPTVTVSGN